MEVDHMARRGRKRGGHRSEKIPVLATVGAVGYGMNVYAGYKRDGVRGMKWEAMGITNEGAVDMAKATQVLAVPVAGAVGSALAAKFKINRYFSGIPMFKL